MLISDWSEEDVSDWLRGEGLEILVDTFRAQNIDGTELISLNKETLDAYFNIGEKTHTHAHAHTSVLYFML